MWKLQRESGGGQLYHFLSGIDYVVGRKSCLILIEDDQSISRSHATLSVSHPPSSLGHPDTIPVLSIKDSSKYGTFVNDEKMATSTSRNLKSGDKVTFGVYNSKFRVLYEPLVVCSSCLSNSEKNTLNQALQQLGGHIVNNWTEKCTHLVMTSIKVTIKTICALICSKSIVKPDYFNEMIKAIKEKRALPAPASYIPIVDEPSLQTDSLDVSENVKRKTIFKDKGFLFLTAKQHKKLSSAIHFGGGEAQLLMGELNYKQLLEDSNTCVIDVGATESQLSESQTSTLVPSIMSILQSKGLRAIPEAEIGLAVIYMSTEIYCNPQQRGGNRNEMEKLVGRNIAASSSFSSSMAVNETILPAATFNTTAYVADTEPKDQTHNWMDISGAREVKETPKSSHRQNSSRSDKCQVRDLDSSSSGDCKAALFQEQIKPTEKKSQPIPSMEKPASQKTSQKMVSSRMQDYFQPTAKKRDREVDEGELSSAKMARVEKNRGSLVSDPVKNVFSVKLEDPDMLSLNDVDFDTAPSVVSKEKPDLSNGRPKGTNEASTSSAVKDASMKRKQPDDVVEESDLENDDDGDKVEPKIPKTDPFVVKRQRLDSGGDSVQDVLAGLFGKSVKTKAPQQSEQKVKTEPSVKQEPSSPQEDKKTVLTVHLKEENDDNLPNRLLLTEFRTLVVSQPAKSNKYTSNAKQGNGPNFKKFRKIAYPGAGSFPHIIGGSDLIAHDKSRNAELEQWLRQEMEEQTQQAKEQSLAEDLFRYNPKKMKKTR